MYPELQSLITLLVVLVVVLIASAAVSIWRSLNGR